MAKIVPHVAQIDRVVRHVRSCCMAQPVRGRTLDPKHVVGIVDAPQPEPLACCGEEMLHNFVDATPTQGAHLAPNRQEEGSRLIREGDDYADLFTRAATASAAIDTTKETP